MSQPSLFEEDYLLRELGQVAHVPQVALTELVANAWDAGASRVDLILPVEVGGTLTITDNGHGMSPLQFRHRWMTLRYNRTKHQGSNVEFPKNRPCRPRKAYGCNGVGRHGLLCFSDEYQVETWRDEISAIFTVGTEAGESPFVLRNETLGRKEGSGTRLMVQVSRKLPDAEEILTVLSTRFVHDPEFEITVNGKSRPFKEIEGIVSQTHFDIDDQRSATVIVIDSTRLNHSSIHQGVAFWVRRRLVGTPSWLIGNVGNIDGRTRFARRYKVIVDTQGFDSLDVEQDWTGFRETEAVQKLYSETDKHIREAARILAEEMVQETFSDALMQNRAELKNLGVGAQHEVVEFTKTIAQAHPTVSPEFLSTAVNAVINLEKSKSGASLLAKLSELSSDDIQGLDRLLAEWSVKDAMHILDEIDSRIRVIEAIRRLADDPNVDELHTLHPLILRSRWLFGPEFESQEYCSNATLQTVARKLFKNDNAKFINGKNRPDIVVLPDKTTVQLTCLESFNPSDATLIELRQVLLIELKKGGFQLTRKEMNQADGYVQDIATGGLVTGTPFVCAWVVGYEIAHNVAKEKNLIDDGRSYGYVRATTFGILVDTANRRMLRLREVLSSRYSEIPTEHLLEKIFSQPEQGNIRI